jgi:hypothetical protein
MIRSVEGVGGVARGSMISRKTDALGRVRKPKDRREAILDAFERSGMSG